MYVARNDQQKLHLLVNFDPRFSEALLATFWFRVQPSTWDRLGRMDFTTQMHVLLAFQVYLRIISWFATFFNQKVIPQNRFLWDFQVRNSSDYFLWFPPIFIVIASKIHGFQIPRCCMAMAVGAIAWWKLFAGEAIPVPRLVSSFVAPFLCFFWSQKPKNHMVKPGKSTPHLPNDIKWPFQGTKNHTPEMGHDWGCHIAIFPGRDLHTSYE